MFWFFADPPEVSVVRSWVNSGEGLEAKLDCLVHADPPAEVSSNSTCSCYYYIVNNSIVLKMITPDVCVKCNII